MFARPAASRSSLDEFRATRGRALAVALVLWGAFAASDAGCASPPRMVPLLADRGAASPPAAATLEIVSRGAAVPDPFPVRGSDVVYGGLEAALGGAVSAATGPWAAAHRDDPAARAGGWTLLVELTAADAELEGGGRVVVRFDVRATLRTRTGNAYLGQTQAGCREGGLVSAGDGAPVVDRCLRRIGADLAGWLGGARLEAPPDSG
jgi:hypothetical protein